MRTLPWGGRAARVAGAALVALAISLPMAAAAPPRRVPLPPVGAYGAEQRGTAGPVVTCRYAPAAKALRVKLLRDSRDGFAVVRVFRRGTELVVRQIFSPHALDCDGPTPTVDNTDSVRVKSSDEVTLGAVELKLMGGPFAPGATAEPAPDSEIEFLLDLRSQRKHSESYLLVNGSPGDDLYRLGKTAHGSGIDLNASEPAPDVDVRLRGVDFHVISSRSGKDRIIGYGGAEFVGAFPKPVFAFSGEGADTLVGSPQRDLLVGEDQRDALRGRGGDDRIEARDGAPDQVRCGRGSDRASVDRRDAVAGCERVRHPR